MTEATERTEWVRDLLGGATVYAAANVLNRAFPFLLLPVLTRYLSPEEYGVYVMFQVVLFFLLPLIGLNSEAAVSREFFRLERPELERYVRNTQLMSGGIGAVLLVVALAAGGPIGGFLSFPGAWLPVVVVVGMGESAKAVHLVLWRMQKRARAYAAFTVCQAAVRTAACILPLVLVTRRLDGLLWGHALSLTAFSLFSLVALRREGCLAWSWHGSHARDYLRYGVPLLPHRMSGWLQGMADRVLIAKLGDLAQLGIYSLGYSLGGLVGLVQDAVNLAWVPFLYERLARADHRARLEIVRFIGLYAIGMAAVAVAVTLMSSLVFPLLGPRFAGARVFVVWIAFAYAVNGVYKMFVNFLFFAGRTAVISAITITTALLGFGIAYALIASRGVIGAGYAAVISQVLTCACVVVVARRAAPMPWREGLRTVFVGLRRPERAA